MQTVSKKNVQLTIEELEKQNESFIVPDNIDRTNLGRDKANIKLYGTTIVNLLGKYGNFETDSNGDGLADGWAGHTDLNTYTVSNGIQRAELTSTPDYAYKAGHLKFIVNDNIFQSNNTYETIIFFNQIIHMLLFS